MIKLIIDSTCDLDDLKIKQNNIDMIPLQVIINNINYKDRIEMDIETLYDHIRKDSDIKTSLPAYDDIQPIFEKYAKDNQPFIFFSFSKSLSGTNNFANILVKELKENYNTQMAVVDLKNGGLANAMILEKVIEFTKLNQNFDEIIAYAEKLANNMHHVVMLEDLTQLRKGGRIGTVKSIISSALSIKPLLKITEDGIKSVKTAIGTKRALNELVLYLEKNAPNKNTEVGINYSANENLLNSMIKLLNNKGYNNLRIGRIASVMTAHIGLDAVSLCFFHK
ncbi:DegV family protein [Acholeplasma granularum]|uniref:DegV family protein n=1 Tax=Acholeplasma granularum TaxID=264635 RepID=UPI00046FBDC4|nr:DegV family protein [Acholeplasma granularum]